MEKTGLERVFVALSEKNIRYLVVGGVAVVLHGHPRFTADLDVVLQLEHDNILAAMDVLEGLGYRPRVPVVATDLANAEVRRSWIEEKGMMVFSMWSPEDPMTEIDIFVEEPFGFDEAYERALHADLGDVVVTVASIEDIINLKQAAGRPKDIEDALALRKISDDQNSKK